MAALMSSTSRCIASRSCSTSSSLSSVCSSRQVAVRRSVLVRAQETEAQDKTLSFEASSAAQQGYVSVDNSGKSNMYPTIPKPYEAGSKSDTTTNASDATLAVAGAGLAFAIIAGLLAVFYQGPSIEAVPDAANFSSLTQYAAKFAAEI